MVRLGIICEDETGKILLESQAFVEKLRSNGIELISVQETGSVNQFFGGRYNKHRELMLVKKVDKIIAFFDLDKEECLVKLKESSDPFAQGDLCIIASKEVESWYLAESKALSTLLKKEINIENPEGIEEPIRKIIELNGGKGFGRSKPFLAQQMLRSGFDFERVALHPNAPSAKYFQKKLKSLTN